MFLIKTPSSETGKPRGQAVSPITAAALRRVPRGIGRARNKGMTLLESLVAIVILALGVLGVLNMQLRTLTDAQTGAKRAQAIWLIDDLSERVNSNTNSLLPMVASRYISSFDDVPSLTGASDFCDSGCTALQYAAWNIAVWKDNVKNTLPDGNAAVFLVKDEASNDKNRRQLGVMVAWREAERTLGRTNDSGTVADLRAQFKISATNVDGVKIECPDGMICHLDYIPLMARCVPTTAGSPDALRCANGVAVLH
jgi:type IV pilus assembly protein PilV